MKVAVEISILLSFLGNHSKTIRKVEGKTHRQYFLVKLRDKYNLQTVKYVKSLPNCLIWGRNPRKESEGRGMKCDMQEGSEGTEVRQLQKYLHLLKVEDAASSSYGNWVSKAESRNRMSRFTPPVEVGVSVIHCCVMNLVTFFFF